MEYNIRAGVRSNVRLTRVDRATGRVLGIEERSNSITNIDKLLDLIDGSATDHPDTANATLQIRDSGGAEVRLITGLMSGYPTTASGGAVTLKWADETTNTYNPDDIRLYTNAAKTTYVPEVLNVAWANKPSSENWYFEWELSITSGDGNFDNAGFNGMLDCIVGESADHWDGTEGSSNMRIKVYDGTPGSLLFSVPVTSATARTTTSLKWIFERSSGSGLWARVETLNNLGSLVLYDDDITDITQNSGDTFTYEITITFS